MSDSYSLGLDLSTQSLTALILDIESGDKIVEHSLNYVSDNRLNRYGIDFSSAIIPPRVLGEADQPPLMFLAAIDALFEDLKTMADLKKIKVINCSAQQHGHVYLSSTGLEKIKSLMDGNTSLGLVQRFSEGFSYLSSPIWKTSNTFNQANEIRQAVGGKSNMIKISGSDSPLRFTAAITRKIGQNYPSVYQETASIKLLSAFLAAILSGNHDAPSDWGNACGMSLMDYSKKSWSPELITACSEGLPGGFLGLETKLGTLGSPLALAGKCAQYFSQKYGVNSDALILLGSGDNPQTKVLVAGDLLSLGTSFVNMIKTDASVDYNGVFNAMYDGLGLPFMFGCRTNGAMVWDKLRNDWGITKNEINQADNRIKNIRVGENVVLYQPDQESLPNSGQIQLCRKYQGEALFDRDYAGVIDSSLALVYLCSSKFSVDTKKPLCVTGGPSGSTIILERIASIWHRPVKTIGRAGAAHGAAIAGAVGLANYSGMIINHNELIEKSLNPGELVQPNDQIADDIRKPGGYFDQVKKIMSDKGAYLI